MEQQTGEVIATEQTILTEIKHETVPLGEKVSYALTNTGQTMIYGLFGFLMLYMTDYLYISPAITGLIIALARVFDAINDPIMGQIVDKTKSKWGKCRPYMLFTPILVAIVTLLLFAPWGLKGGAAIAYVIIFYILFDMVYTANDIPYWSMSAAITTDPKQRTTIVTMTRLIGGLGSAMCIGLFWTFNNIFEKSLGASKNGSFFLAVCVFCVFGAAIMLQGFFNTKERAKCDPKQKNSLSNLLYIFKAKPLLINLIGGSLYSIMTIGTTALTTYFVKWNVKEIFPNMASNDIMSIFTPVIGFLPAVATVIGLLVAPLLIKKLEKKNLLIAVSIFGGIINIISFFVGYENLWIFLVLRFFAFLPVGIWSSVTTLMIGDSVDYIEYKTGKRLEGTCFSLLTFMGKFQNSINVALSGIILSIVGYNGELDPNKAQQSPDTLMGIFVMVTLIAGVGYLISMIPFFFYKLDNKTCKMMAEENLKRRLESHIETGSEACV